MPDYIRLNWISNNVSGCVVANERLYRVPFGSKRSRGSRISIRFPFLPEDICHEDRDDI